jgi:primosomal protein N''
VLHVVLGRKKKKRYKLALNLRDGSTGKIVETFDLLLKAQRLADDDQRQLADKLMPQLAALAPTATATPIATPTPAPAEEPAPVDDTTASDDRDRVTEKPSRSPAKGERGRLLDVKTDNRGQVIDDEVPRTHSR